LIGRSVTLLTTIGAAVVAVSTIAAKPVPRYIWNASGSVPIGLYRLHPAGTLAVAQLVAVQSPEPLATLLADRSYLPRGIPLLKHVLALPGQTICRDQLVVTVDKIEMGEALAHDRSGRLLPTWQGCHVIADGEVFLMNWRSADSFDGRYFGVLPMSAILGTAESLWTSEEK
jgi:conjugative transfer signal peptidase TraF